MSLAFLYDTATAVVRPSVLRQFFPERPAFTDMDLPDLAGRVLIVTGATAGVGRRLAHMLYEHHATVYLACRSEDKTRRVMDEIRTALPESHGRLELMCLDLADLRTIRPAVDAFLARESRLDVLFNNAGVLMPGPEASTTAQGYEREMGVNCLGPFLLTRLLTPRLTATAAGQATGPSVAPGSVRIVWVSSISAEGYTVRGGVDVAGLPPTAAAATAAAAVSTETQIFKYARSKAGDYLYSAAFAHRLRADGVVSVAVNPGNLDSDLYRTLDGGVTKTLFTLFVARPVLYPPIFGAYTELFAGLSPAVTMDQTGAWIGPWGRFFDIRKDLTENAKPQAEGGGGGADAFYAWSEEQVKAYL